MNNLLAQAKQEKEDVIRNFIEYYTSDDAERARMIMTLADFMEEVHEEPTEVMVFTADVKNGQDIYWKRAITDNSPTSVYIPAEELHTWVQKYKGHGWASKVN
jgi:hypothetical protein